MKEETLMRKSSKVLHRLAAAATVGMMGTASTAALANGGGVTDANTLVSHITTASKGFTDLISLLGYVGGSGLSVAGIFKLKQHVDNPGQTPLKDGVMRLAAGGALLSLPFITSVMQGSVNEGNGAAGASAANASVAQFGAAG
jgi:hypothetical protein